MKALFRRCLRGHGNLSHSCGCLSLRASVLWAALFQILLATAFIILAAAPGWRLVDFVDLSFELKESLTAKIINAAGKPFVEPVNEVGENFPFILPTEEAQLEELQIHQDTSPLNFLASPQTAPEMEAGKILPAALRRRKGKSAPPSLKPEDDQPVAEQKPARLLQVEHPHTLHLTAENQRLRDEMQRVALRFERWARWAFAVYGGQCGMRGVLGGLAALLCDARVSWHLWLWTVGGGSADVLFCVALPVALWLQGAALSVRAWALVWLPCLYTPLTVWWQSQLVFSLFRVQSVGGKGSEHMDAQQLQQLLTEKALHAQ